MQHKGVIAQVLGPVVDVQFAEGSLPQINEELVVEKDGERRVMEVAREIGHGAVRCILLSPGEGLGRGDEVIATGPHHRGRPSAKPPWAVCSTSWASPSTEKGPRGNPRKVVHPPGSPGF